MGNKRLMPEKISPALKRRIYLLTFLGVFVPGVGLAIAILVVSLFYSGLRAEYLRIMSFAFLGIMFVAGILRVLMVYIQIRLLNRRGPDDIY